MEKKKNVFKEYIDENFRRLSDFARLSNVSYHTLYPLYKGMKSRPHRWTAEKIVRVSNGKLSMSDFGH